ncbi:MAG TPA: hypothetical protein VJ417_06285, partial [Candidatus Glassbacteria bacterium]|nr:hypothetical protein [Candidatus Glassbacteria bacterium]
KAKISLENRLPILLTFIVNLPGTCPSKLIPSFGENDLSPLVTVQTQLAHQNFKPEKKNLQTSKLKD